MKTKSMSFNRACAIVQAELREVPMKQLVRMFARQHGVSLRDARKQVLKDIYGK